MNDPWRRLTPPPEILGNPVVVWIQVPHEKEDSYALFLVITQVGHLYNIHKVKRYRHSSGTRSASWVTKERAWAETKELFEQRLAALGIALPRDFFRDKQRPWA